jgi:hypothetical protein
MFQQLRNNSPLLTTVVAGTTGTISTLTISGAESVVAAIEIGIVVTSTGVEVVIAATSPLVTSTGVEVVIAATSPLVTATMGVSLAPRHGCVTV